MYLVVIINLSFGDMVFVNGNFMCKQDVLFKEVKLYYNGQFVILVCNKVEFSLIQKVVVKWFEKVFNLVESFLFNEEL